MASHQENLGGDAVKRGPPLGVQMIRKLRGRDASFDTYRYSVLFMTFVAYACYHSARKPFSVVKSVLDDAETDVNLLNRTHVAMYPFLPVNHLVSGHGKYSNSSHWYYGSSAARVESTANGTSNGTTPTPMPRPRPKPGALQGWAPFNKSGGKGLLGDVDLAFLASYAFGMYFAGQLGDRLDLRYFLTWGMVGSGAFVCLLGAGYWLDVHSIYFFVVVQMLAGLLQSSGWPSVVAVVGKWFGKRKRGLIMGIWNGHTSFGNILGSLLATAGLEYGWGLSFVLPGAVLMAGGVLVFFFLVVEPMDVGLVLEDDAKDAEQERLRSQGHVVETEDVEAGGPVKEAGGASVVHGGAEKGDGRSAHRGDEEAGLLLQDGEGEEGEEGAKLCLPVHFEAVGFLQAWNIPGVAPFAFCLFFSKLVAYTFLNWLPFYITQTRINGKFLSDEMAGKLSTLFDVGGFVGGIMAGHLSDKLGARAITASAFMYMAIPALYLYRTYGSVSMGLNVALMMVAGLLVNGPYALITTAVSADLGTHSSLKGSPRALATVTAIIDGTGSVGAALGPLLTGYISEVSWDYVFLFLMLSACMAGLLLTRLVVNEVRIMIQNSNSAFAKDITRQTNEGGGSLTQRLLDGGN